MRPFVLPGFVLVCAGICGYVAIELAAEDSDGGTTPAVVVGIAALALVGFAVLLWVGRDWRIFAYAECDPVSAVRTLVVVGLVPAAITAWSTLQGIDDDLGHSIDAIVAKAPKPVDPKSAEIPQKLVDTSMGEATLQQVMPTIAKTVESYVVHGRLPSPSRLDTDLGLPRRFRIRQVRDGPGSAYSFCLVDRTMKVWAVWSSHHHRLTGVGSGVACGRHVER